MKHWNNTIAGLVMMIGPGAALYVTWKNGAVLDFGDRLGLIVFVIAGVYFFIKGVRNKFS